LLEVGVDYAQGFAIHKPQPLDPPLSKQADKLDSRFKLG